jgi:hypothetical protein
LEVEVGEKEEEEMTANVDRWSRRAMDLVDRRAKARLERPDEKQDRHKRR